MREKKVYSGDKDIQLILGTLLRAGVITSMAVIIVGGCIYLLGNHSKSIDYTVFDPYHSKLSSIASVFSGILVFHGDAIIQFGILLLIFTPILRVVFSIFGFLIERDYLYVSIGLFVLAVILFSLSNRLVG
jgi:uncharacterized membrane protein